ncbi:MAG: SdrD B-like domain-containing protein [Acidobacteriota bacterium]
MCIPSLHRGLARCGLLVSCGLILAALLAASALPAFAAGTVTGTVFRDYDADGADDGAFEPGVGGLTVTAYDAAGAVAGSIATCSATGVPSAGCNLSNLGFYELSVAGAGPYRLELTGLPVTLRPGAVGSNSSTTVRFVADPSGGTTANVDFAVANPAQHCLPGTRVATPCYVNGDPLTTPGGACAGGGSAAADFDAFVTFLDTVDSNNGTGVTHVADADQLGSVWGVAWQRTSQTLFAAATVKRHVGLGPLPVGSAGSRTGVIYRLTGDLGTDDAAAVLPWFNLDDITGVDTGAEPAARGLDPCTTEPSYDPNAFDAIGKLGLGDLDISEDGLALWVVNLFDRTLYELAIGDPPQVPGDAQVTAHPFGAAEPSCTAGVFRPWAVKAHEGLVYVGGVCTGEAGGTASDLTAHVLAHDPAGATGNFTEVFQMDLDYPRGKVSDQGSNEPAAEWRPWIDEWSDINSPAPGSGPFGQTMYPQPVLADMEFDIDGAILLGFMDRAGQQMGNENYQTNGVDTATFEGVAAGDVLRVCFDPDDTNGDSNPYVLELGSDCPGPLGPTLGSDQSPGQGPGNREFYWTDYYRWDNNTNAPDAGTHQEITLGGLSHRFGSGEVGASAFDPYDNFRAGGVIWMSNADGSRTHSLEVFGQDAGGQPATFGKAAGIGDMEVLCTPAPLELGNRVWCDDGDGVQEGGETSIPGVNVVLTCGGDTAVTATTDAQGLYLFTDAAYQGVNGTRIPRGASCTISIDTAANAAALASACGAPVFPTVANSGSGAVPDLNDSDGVDGGGSIVQTAVSTGSDGDNNHSYDFGFSITPPPLGTIGDTVWCDGLEGTGNGTFDAGEGLTNITVSLFDDTNCDNVADGGAIGAMSTAGDGQYLFQNLPIGTPGDPVCYVVQVDTADADLGTCNSPITPVETSPDLDTDNPDDLDNNFGFEEPLGTGSIGDTVWCDGLEGTGNGTFDAGEGLTNITVSLFDDTDCDNVADGGAIGAMATAGDGQYLFTGLPIGPPGNPVCYVVQVDTADVDLGTCNSPITPVETSPDLDSDNPDDLDNDFGFEEPLGTGSIGDTVWCDGFEGTGNGTFDAGEGLPNVTISLFDDPDCDDVADGGAIGAMATAGDGQYLFTGLPIGPPGNPVCYVVQVDTADLDLGTCNVPITPVETSPDLDSDNPDDLDNDFGFEEPLGTGSIGDTVWCDGLEGTGNGTFDAGEGLPDVTVTLFDDPDCDDVADGGAIGTMSTAGDGQYLFTGLPIGPPGIPVCYVVQVDAADPDLGTCTIPITPVETSPDLDNDNPDDLDNDFGFEEPCNDDDGDGVCNESCVGDRDGDGEPDCSDFDPQGYFYCEDTGQILPGGSIAVSGPGSVDIVEDGSSGRYTFFTDGTPGVYELLVTPPADFPLSTECSDSGILDPTGQPDPLLLGTEEVLDTGFLSSPACSDNPYYLFFDLEAGDPVILANNIPLRECRGPDVVEVPTASGTALGVLGLLLAASALLLLRRRLS